MRVQHPKRRHWGIWGGILGTMGVAWLDWMTGNDWQFAFLYLGIIGATVWISGRMAGLVIAVISANAWLIISLLQPEQATPKHVYWATAMRLLVFVGFNYVLALLLARTREHSETRKAAQERDAQLADQEYWLGLALQSGGMVAWDWDVERDRVRYSNNVQTIARGANLEPYLSRRALRQEMHPEDRAQFDQAIGHALHADQEFICQYRVRMQDGEYHWIRAVGRVVARPGGRPTRMMGISQDITQSQQIVEKLARSEQRLREAFTASRDGYWEWNLKTDEVFYSPRWKEMLGYSEDEVSHHFESWRRLVHPEDWEATLRLIQKHLACEQSEPFHSEIRMRHRQGHWVDILSRGMTIRGADGQPVRMVGTHVDISARKREAAELQKLARIVETAEDAIITTTAAGEIQSWNPGAMQLFGYPAREMVGQPLARLIPPNRRADFIGILERSRGSEHNANFEMRCLNRSGALLPVSINVSLLRDQTGQTIGFSLIIRDISERNRYEEEIARIADSEQQRIADEIHDQLGAYLAGTAFHAKALAERLEQQGVSEAETAAQLVKVANAATRQIRSFCRLLSVDSLVTTDLASGLTALGPELKLLFGVTLHLELSPDLLLITGDPAHQLFRIAREAARNAILHARATQVWLKLQPTSDGLLELTVTHDGDVWITPSSPEQTQGVRLMRYRAARLGGSIEIQNTDHGRATVRCAVPLAGLHEPSPAPPQASTPPLSPRGTSA